MNDETKMLREVLQSCCTVLGGIRDLPLELAAYGNRNEVIDLVLSQAHFTLQVTSGKLPEGYEVIKWPMSFRPTYEGEYILIKGTYAGFDDEFKARVFCWEHFGGEI
jgi:hypothetical protein